MSRTGQFDESELAHPLKKGLAPISCELLDTVYDTQRFRCVSAVAVPGSRGIWRRYRFQFVSTSDPDFTAEVKDYSPTAFFIDSEYTLQRVGNVYRIPEYDSLCWKAWEIPTAVEEGDCEG